MDSLRVLFVDRDSPESEEICSVLMEASHLVLPAGSLDEACEALFVQRFDAVLLGASLPLNGLPEFSEKLRQVERNQRSSSRIPILSLSSPSAGAAPDPASVPLVDGYLPDPFEPVALTEAVRNLAKAVQGGGPASGGGSAELPVFAPDEFQEQVGYDPDLLIEIVDLFLAESGQQIPAMREALACTDYAQLRRLSHTIKGSLGSLHAARAKSRAQQLESAAANERKDACQALLAELEADLETLIPQIVAVRDGSDRN